MTGVGCVRSRTDNAQTGEQGSSAAPAAAASTSTAQGSSTAPAPDALDPLTHGWELTKRYTYQVKTTSRVALGDTNAFDFDVTGNLEVVPVTGSASIMMLHAALGDTTIMSRLPGTQPGFDKLATEITSSECFFTLEGGRLTELRIPRNLSTMAAATYRQIAAALQFARVVGDGATYSADEYDTTGQYIAEYERGAEPNLWHKRKQRYVTILTTKSAKANVPANVIPDVSLSRGEVRLDSEGRPLSVSLEEETAVNGAQLPIRSTTSVSLEGGPPQPARQAPKWLALLDNTVQLAADEPYGGVAPAAALDQARIKGLTFAKIVSRLEQAARNQIGPGAGADTPPANAAEQAQQEGVVQDDMQIFQALAAIYRQQPATIGQTLRKVQAKSPASPTLIDALGSAGSPAAQKALTDLMNSKALESDLRARAATALALTANPDRASADAFKATLASDPWNARALYGLGSFSRRMRDTGNADMAKELGAFLVGRLKASEGPLSLTIVLRAISNSGYTDALPAILPYLTDEREQIRVDAVRALQSMQSSKVDEVLAARLQADDSADVRISAIEAARVREPSDVFVEALVAASTSSERRVRYQAIDLMTQWLARRPQLRATLTQAAQSDEEARIRYLAQSAL
jgi:hypothetical protein